jgi:hypothetical protein
MELKQIWRDIDSKILKHPTAGSLHIKQKSNAPVQKILNIYRLGFILIGFILAMLIIYFLIAQTLALKISIAAVIVVFIGFMLLQVTPYIRISHTVRMDQDARVTIIKILEFVTANMRLQERVGLFLCPIAAGTGFILGLLAKGKSINLLVSNRSLLFILAVTSIILTPLGFYASRWMNNRSFGRYIKELKRLIEEF